MIVVLVVLIVLVLVVVASLALRRRDEQTFRFDEPVSRVDVDVPAGGVRVSAGEDGPVTVRRTVRWLVSRPRFEHAVDDGVLRLRVTGSPLVSGVVEFDVIAPKAVDVNARSRAGALEADGIGSREAAANTEVKCFDPSANPYLLAGALIAAGLSGMERNLTLPDEVTVDPGGLSEEELSEQGIRRLPSSVEEAVSHLEKSDVLRDAMGPMLFGPFLAVRRAEADAFAGQEPEEVVAAHRWRY